MTTTPNGRGAIAAVAMALVTMIGASAGAADTDILLLRGAKIYTAPDVPPLTDGDVLLREGTIAAVGPRGTLNVPQDTTVLDCAGLFVTAGFQNSHVHFMEPKWSGAASAPASQLASGLVDMLTSFGVTTVVDTGSVLQDTTALRARIESGEIPGPRILTAGTPLYPPDGIPIYLKDLPPEVLSLLPQPTTPAEAAGIVRANLHANGAAGADVVKLFAGSVMGGGKVKPMPVEIARAAVMEAHSKGKNVFAHPTNAEGARVAIESGVDVLAHTNSAGWDEELVAEMVAHGMALVPTLKLWPFEVAKDGASAEATEAFLSPAIAQLRAFAKAGGQVLFGTDVGYMTDYDPTDEYVLMSRAGLSSMQILAALTTNPADEFDEGATRGRIEPGMVADLVVLDGDPMDDIRNFAKVRYTIRSGRPIYCAEGHATACN